ncbi:DUF3592 domain-containing protein [Enterobacter sp. Bisph1]|uniref:DUF3592 domain-containing protein n=1 Tax=Enterobacter sp. Bisph1 TaxID=1274399 RepID=UPI00057C07AE|nr:DUF3592 domain-containing protein [Enterobacter sp. Bisph1]
MATIAMLGLLTATVILAVVVFIGIRNSVVSARSSESIRQNGTTASALIVNAEQHRNQNAEGRLSLNLTVEFTVDMEKVVTQKDVIVKIFEADAFKPGQYVTIRYKNDSPKKIVVLGDIGN